MKTLLMCGGRHVNLIHTCEMLAVRIFWKPSVCNPCVRYANRPRVQSLMWSCPAGMTCKHLGPFRLGSPQWRNACRPPILAPHSRHENGGTSCGHAQTKKSQQHKCSRLVSQCLFHFLDGRHSSRRLDMGLGGKLPDNAFAM